MTREKYIAAQDAFIEMTGMKIGSKVKILRKAEAYEHGWPNSWSDIMRTSGEYTVSGMDAFGITFKEVGYGYPFFILEVIAEPLPESIPLNEDGDYFVKFTTGGDVSVGCQTVSYETLKQIFDTATKVKG